MRFLSNFDTQLYTQTCDEVIIKYWRENVLFLTRANIFLYLYVILPIFLWFVAMLFLFLLWYYADLDVELNWFKWYLILFIFLVSAFVLAFRVIKRFIDYKMDFAIVTPYEIIAYNQTWLFSRNVRTIDSAKIKTVTVDKKWILKSIFNYGSVIVLTEWDDEERWDIQLYYLYNPDFVRKEIWRITDFGELSVAKQQQKQF